MFEFVNKNRAYVKSLQLKIGVRDDGVAGKNTLKAAEEFYDSQVIAHKGQIVPIDFDGKINHNYSLYKLPDGTKNHYVRKTPIDNIVVHWGGLNPLHCYQVFFNPKYAHTSSHFLIGRNTRNGEMEVFQCLDTGLAAYHAGKANKQSIGIDICMHPMVKYWDKTKDYYPGAQIVKNSSKRGPQGDIVDIDPELADLSNRFLRALNEVCELTHKPVCRDENVYNLNDAKKFSILGHHNFSKQKWDVIPWADRLYHNIENDNDEYC